MSKPLDRTDRALVELGRLLDRAGYDFTTVTPETHRRVNLRAEREGRAQAVTLRDIFGWSRAFAGELLPPEMLEALCEADQVVADGALLRSRVRYSRLQGRLFVHSAFPTIEGDAVFFGPDTYRFCALLKRWAPPHVRRLVDVGCGSGAGGIVIAERADEVVLSDISPRALAFARVNAELSEVAAETVVSDILQDVRGPVDLIVANPPYLHDDRARLYRDGGGAFGEGIALRILSEGLQRLQQNGTKQDGAKPGGMLILYTGSAVSNGHDTFLECALPIVRYHGAGCVYEELDPDVFGEELERPKYAQVERIAAVAMMVSLSGRVE